MTRAAILLALLLAACTPRYVLPGPPTVAPQMSDEALRAPDGTALKLRTWAAERPRAMLIAVHSFNDYANSFAGFAEWLRGEGVTTLALDQRGFGDTPVRGRWPGSDALIDDVDLLVREVRKREPLLPLYVLGDSMGSAVVLSWAAAKDTAGIRGLVLVAPAVWGWRALNPLYKFTLFTTAHSFPWMKLTGRGLNIWPSDNIEMLRALARDPKVIKETRVDTLYGLVSLMDRGYRAAAHVTLPTLVLYGRKDAVVPAAPVRHVVKALGSHGRFVVYPDGYHMLLRDLQAQKVWADIGAFLKEPRAPLPSGHEQTSMLHSRAPSREINP